MADRNLAIRLAVIDGGKVKAELRDVGDAGSRSLQRIEDAARPASRALQALDSVSAEVRGGLEAMSGRLGALGSGLARLGPIGLAAGAALAGLTPEQAAKQPTTEFSAALTADQLTPLVDLMVKFGWLTSAPDLSSFVGQ